MPRGCSRSEAGREALAGVMRTQDGIDFLATASSPRTACYARLLPGGSSAGCTCKASCMPGTCSACSASTAAYRAGSDTPPMSIPAACGGAYLELLLSLCIRNDHDFLLTCHSAHRNRAWEKDIQRLYSQHGRQVDVKRQRVHAL